MKAEFTMQELFDSRGMGDMMSNMRVVHGVAKTLRSMGYVRRRKHKRWVWVKAENVATVDVVRRLTEGL